MNQLPLFPSTESTYVSDLWDDLLIKSFLGEMTPEKRTRLQAEKKWHFKSGRNKERIRTFPKNFRI